MTYACVSASWCLTLRDQVRDDADVGDHTEDFHEGLGDHDDRGDGQIAGQGEGQGQGQDCQGVAGGAGEDDCP